MRAPAYPFREQAPLRVAENLAQLAGLERDGSMSRETAKKPAKAKASKTSKAPPPAARSERRSEGDRRAALDRREMPRPEGRRTNGGRRATDSTEI
jgi:hypothetical protein